MIIIQLFISSYEYYSDQYDDGCGNDYGDDDVHAVVDDDNGDNDDDMIDIVRSNII